jgi:hypothetical protein
VPAAAAARDCGGAAGEPPSYGGQSEAGRYLPHTLQHRLAAPPLVRYKVSLAHIFIRMVHRRYMYNYSCINIRRYDVCIRVQDFLS